ncbi:uncharacterized protein F4807DRAFT_421733 [Annulohypoxylon truncatum]|uniref:uncharacterized protein n=1 Tax=Annulohypoxylon truncatum TaxID=327061 RepID=UPI0020079163|nr:uncharacterized protein F4807DRAFT_421733 [Annulohypoxylon truncatum]KAI1210519.1 hypothetical protein F4807DRAFT_421733 [Annulohypoxylon truncatum]
MPHPHSDNMYSRDDGSESDGENYADQLSPLDGYFASSSSSSREIPNVPNIIVPDPTLQQTSESGSESKAPAPAPAPAPAQRPKEERIRSNTQRTREYCFHPPIGLGNNEEFISLSEQRAGTPVTSSQRQHNPTSAHTYSPLLASHIHTRSYTTRSRTPSIYSDAPPAYSPEPSPVAPINQQTQSRNYNTITSAMGVSDVVENERLLGRGPESMGQPQDVEAGYSSHWMKTARRRLPTWLNCRVCTLALIVLVVSIGFLAGSLRIFKVEDDHRKTIGAQPIKQNPPDSAKEPVTEPGTDMPGVAAPFAPTYCENAQYRFEDQVLALDFGSNRNVTFIEDQHAHSGTSQVRVAGQINVRRLDSGGGSPRLVLEIATNDKDILLDVYADAEAQALKVSVPKKYDVPDPRNWPCVEIRATLWVPRDAALGVLSLSAVHLDILLLDDLALRVVDYSRLDSVIGSISSGADRPLSYNNNSAHFAQMAPDFTYVPVRDTYVFDSRVIEVTTTSGRIDGNWPLYDMLGLHTTSGDIGVSITPQAELASDPKPGVLSLSSISGAVRATEPVHMAAGTAGGGGGIPLRDYLVDVKSTSGGIRGAFAFGAGVEIKSTASDVALDLLPVMRADRVSAIQPAQLETATTSGTTAVRVLEPLWFDSNGTAVVNAGRPLDCLQALHKSTSGNIGLRYPQAWEGDLYAETTAGQLKVRGKDVRVVRSVGGWPGSKVEAQKGPGGPGSTVRVHALMGNMDAVIGRE